MANTLHFPTPPNQLHASHVAALRLQHSHIAALWLQQAMLAYAANAADDEEVRAIAAALAAEALALETCQREPRNAFYLAHLFERITDRLKLKADDEEVRLRSMPLVEYVNLPEWTGYIATLNDARVNPPRYNDDDDGQAHPDGRYL